ncbi:MAG: rhodanese-like domain-containing protein [Saprospiraceae bacterium]
MQRFKLLLFLIFSGIMLSIVISGPVRAHEDADSGALKTRSTAQKMQLVLLLDTSSSMDGLIEQAKSQLWSPLVALSQTKKDGKAPVLEMALYEYGNSRLLATDGFVKQVIPFTSDMDAVSAALFELSTSGGNEYCGEVIVQSLEDLAWEQDPNAARIVFIAGNEGFDQGNTPFATACAKAMEADVTVNTIFCGPCQRGIQLHWKEGADLTGGHYSCIDQNQVTVYVATPVDKELAILDTRLNETYLAYGAGGAVRQRLQLEQDSNANVYGQSNATNRTSFKISSNYNNSSWDLVDAYAADSTVVKRASVLPAHLADKSVKEVKRQVEELTRRRKEIQEEIRAYSLQRDMYIEATKKQTKGTDLEGAMLKAIYEQAAKKNFVRSDSGLLNTTEPATGGINTEPNYPRARVSLTDFADLVAEVGKDRDDRLLSLQDFLVDASDPKTVVLDARSRNMYERRHIKGSINIPYTEFTEETLTRNIPDPETRILIYCNNNFTGDRVALASKVILQSVAQQRGVRPRLLALNIPTHVTLRGYGYQNIFELDELVDVMDPRMQGHWEGNRTWTLGAMPMEVGLGE